MNQPLFRKQAIDNQRERLWGEVTFTQPVSMTLVTVTITILLAGIATYLYVGSYTRKQTVQGYLSPKAGLVQVHPVQRGTISRVYVKPGERVSEGDLLADVETDRFLGNGYTVNAMLLDILEQQRSLLILLC